MPDTLTPAGLAKELGVAPRAVRQSLRDQGWQSVPHSRWHLTPDQAAAVRERFRDPAGGDGRRPS